jgi:hypothetical protein
MEEPQFEGHYPGNPYHARRAPLRSLLPDGSDLSIQTDRERG